MRNAIVVLLYLFNGHVAGQFDLQFIGDSVSELDRDYCESKYCLLDANILFYAATQNASVKACDDFKEFSLGTFIKYRAVDDREQYNGLWADVRTVHNEKQRKLLAEKINESKDSRVVKVMKKYFAQCVNATFVKGDGTKDFRDYFKSFGISIYPTVDQSNFNMSKVFDEEPEESTYLLLKHELQRCPHPNDDSKEILCLKSVGSWKNPELIFDGYADVLYEMNNIYKNASFGEYFQKEFKKISSRMLNFYRLQEKSISQTNQRSKFIKIKNLDKLTRKLSINWQTILNNQLLAKSRLTENDAIWVERPQVIKALARLIASSEKSLIADYFVYYFLYTYRFVIIPYAHDEFELTKVGNKKSPQRWMQCGFCFDCHMRPAVAFIYLERYRDEKIVESAKVFVREAINFALSNVINGTELKNTVKFDVMRRLTSMRIIIGFPEEILSSQKNEEFYDELSLSGNESYFEACREFHKHHHKLENERKKTYRRRLDEITLKSEVEFIAQDNVLFVPSIRIQYPWYHPDRPRFFNTATLFTDILQAIRDGLRSYLKITHNVTQLNLITDPFQLGYENYLQWEELGGQDMQIGANRLSNRQMYWVAIARKYFAKFHSVIPDDFLPFNRLQNDYLHVWLKRKSGFQEAFDCEMRHDEEQKYDEYSRKWQLIHQREKNKETVKPSNDIEAVSWEHKHICKTLRPW